MTFDVLMVKCTDACYSMELRDKHSCVENSMRHHCPICYEVCVYDALFFYLSFENFVNIRRYIAVSV